MSTEEPESWSEDARVHRLVCFEVTQSLLDVSNWVTGQCTLSLDGPMTRRTPA